MAKMITIIFRNDDPGALSDPIKERKVLELFERYQIPQVLAVIPNNIEDPHVSGSGQCHHITENPAVIEILKEYHAKGLVEMAVHGYTHQTNRFRPSVDNIIREDAFYQGIDRKWVPYQPAHEDGYSEFNGLPVREQEERVVKGREELEKVFKMKFQSYIFPWNAHNPEVLKILKKQGFKYVPIEDDIYRVSGLCLIGCCNWDWEIDKFFLLLDEMDKLNNSVLTQFAYHSWEVDDIFLEKLEKLFIKIRNMKNVQCVRPCDIPTSVSWAPFIISLRTRMLKLEDKLAPLLKWNMYRRKYYVHSIWYYLKRIISLQSTYVILKIGRKRFRKAVLSGAVLAFLIVFGRVGFNMAGLADIFLIAFVAVIIAGFKIFNMKVGPHLT